MFFIQLKKSIGYQVKEHQIFIYLKVTIETFSKLQFSGFKKICQQVSFWGAPTHADIIKC